MASVDRFHGVRMRTKVWGNGPAPACHRRQNPNVIKTSFRAVSSAGQKAIYVCAEEPQSAEGNVGLF